MISGQISVCKVYNDGTEEIILDKANMITMGLGYSFCDILQSKGSLFVEDYTPTYFQVGTSGQGYDTALTTSSFFYGLSTPFDWQDYGADTDIEVEKQYRAFLVSSTDPAAGIWEEMLFTSALVSAVAYSGVDDYFGKVVPSRITKFYMDCFDSEIILDENSGNGKAITEVGLYIRNPRGVKDPSPLLVAYKKFDAIAKEKNFSIIIHWAIGWLGLSKETDYYYSPGPPRHDDELKIRQL